MASTRQRLMSELPDEGRPVVHLHAMCHSRLQVARHSCMIRPHMLRGLFLRACAEVCRTCNQMVHLQNCARPDLRHVGILSCSSCAPLVECGVSGLIMRASALISSHTEQLYQHEVKHNCPPASASPHT